MSLRPLLLAMPKLIKQRHWWPSSITASDRTTGKITTSNNSSIMGSKPSKTNNNEDSRENGDDENSDLDCKPKATDDAGHVSATNPSTTGDSDTQQELEDICKFDEQYAIAQFQQEHELAMSTTLCGKTFQFVQGILELHERIFLKTTASSNMTILPVAKDDLFHMAEKFVEAQSLFVWEEDKPGSVDIGYHYTKLENLQSIQTTGLLTKVDRVQHGVDNNFNGASLGDGIYTGNNPFSYRGQRYGYVGIVVARLKGNVGSSTSINDVTKDTIVSQADTPMEMVVLKQSYQCVPLLQIQHYQGKENTKQTEDIWMYHCAIQEMLDKLFNIDCGYQFASLIDSNQLPFSWKPTTGGARRRSSKFRMRQSQKQPPIATKRTPVVATSNQVSRSPPPTNPIPQVATTVPTHLPHQQIRDIVNGWSDGIPNKMDSSPHRSEYFEQKDQDDGNKIIATMRFQFYPKDVLTCCDYRQHGTVIVIYSWKVKTNDENDTYRWHYCREYFPDDPSTGVLLTRLMVGFLDGRITVPETILKFPQCTNPYLKQTNMSILDDNDDKQHDRSSLVSEYHKILNEMNVLGTDVA